MQLNLHGHRALICGASQGIGLKIAEQFAEAGAELVLLARNRGRLEDLAKNLSKKTKVQIIETDLGQTAALQKAVSEVLNQGPIDILVNNAGGPGAGPILSATPESFLESFKTHVIAAQVLAQLLVPGMKEKRYGRIINIISTSVKIPIPNLGVSNTIRGAMASWSKTMANELGPFGITVNNVLPGYTSTERLTSLKQNSAQRLNVSIDEVEKQWLETIPARRFAEPVETAVAATFLASPAASYINGVNLPVDGGRTGSL